MLFSRVTPVALLFALATSALGAVNTKQTVDGLNDLQKRVIETRKSIEGWNGGLMGAIPVASKIQTLQNTAANTRRTIDQSDAFENDDQDAVMAAYQQLHPELVGALNAAEQKAPAFKDAGVGFVARAMIEDLSAEKDKFKTAMQGKVPAESYRSVEPGMAEVDAAFDKTRKALAA
ncbi:hypothetical protein IFM51744_01022 [Aspergillus udagawae]|nr:hypothetical protein IFM51744_01022 [Aspergillus udagawae]